MTIRISEGSVSVVLVRRMLAAALMTGCLSACATAAIGNRGVIVQTVWQVRDQYVAVEKQERPAGVTVTANDHPAEISAGRLRNALESIEARMHGKGEATALFNERELAILSKNILQALRAASPGDDVTFAVIGDYPTMLGILKEPKVTTGRVFCRDGRLNIIFGDVLRDVKADEDRRLWPFVPGSRGATISRAWALTAKPGTVAFTLQRPDWVTFPMAGNADLNSGSTDTPVAAHAVPRKEPTATGKKGIEERLLILKELLDKKLITEEEYRAKRLEILNEL